MLPKYQEVENVNELSAEDKLKEIKRAHQWLADNYIRNNDKHNYYVYVYFADIVQRLVF